MSKSDKIYGNSQRPRISVLRSNKYISAQVIDDQKGVTILSKSSKSINVKGTTIENAMKTGELIGEAIKEKKIAEVVFDRGSYRYHGQVKALAEGIRKAGIKF